MDRSDNINASKLRNRRINSNCLLPFFAANYQGFKEYTFKIHTKPGGDKTDLVVYSHRNNDRSSVYCAGDTGT